MYFKQGNSRAINARIQFLKNTHSGPLHFTTADLFISLIYGLAWNRNINENIHPPVDPETAKNIKPYFL